MKPRHGAAATAVLSLIGTLGLGAAGLNLLCNDSCESTSATTTLVAAESDCSSASSCETTATAVAAKSDCGAGACDETKATMVAEKSDCSTSSCETTATAVADKSDCGAGACDETKATMVAAKSDCSTSSCETTATAVAAKSDCGAGACDESEATMVAAKGDCGAGACDESKATMVAGKSDCSTSSCDDAKTTLVAGDADGCCGGAEAALAAGKDTCGTACEEGATAVADTGDCGAGACDDSKAAMVAGNGDCSGSSCSDSKTAGVPMAVNAFNTGCPYSGGDVKADIASNYKGMKVAFCCNGCKGKFDNADDAKRAKLVANAVTPINDTCCGKPADAKTMTVAHGFPVAFCGEKCAAWYDKAPVEKQAAFVSSLVKPVNSECCGTDASEATMVGFHNGKAVALCGETCAEYFNAASAEKKDAWFAKLASDKKMSCGDECAKDCCEA